MELAIKYLPIDEIKPYENNPRISDDAVEYVANSIKKFGFKVPIVVDAEGVIVAGHTRVRGAKKLGLKSVPCIIADDLTPEQIKAYRIADNSVGEASRWDFDKLDEELAELADFDLEDFGLHMFDNVTALMETAGYDVDEKESEIFSITFNFPMDYETLVKNYIKENGKEELVKMIIGKCKGE